MIEKIVELHFIDDLSSSKFSIGIILEEDKDYVLFESISVEGTLDAYIVCRKKDIYKKVYYSNYIKKIEQLVILNRKLNTYNIYGINIPYIENKDNILLSSLENQAIKNNLFSISIYKYKYQILAKGLQIKQIDNYFLINLYNSKPIIFCLEDVDSIVLDSTILFLIENSGIYKKPNLINS